MVNLIKNYHLKSTSDSAKKLSHRKIEFRGDG